MRAPGRPFLVLLCVAALSGGAAMAARAPEPGATAREPVWKDPITRREYPARWWSAVPPESAASWEILPQAAKPGEVIVSKRNELGLLSNFAATPFVYRGKRYASVEGFWQSMLYPEGARDPRARFPGLAWPHTRDEVAAMTAFDAKRAGELAERNLRAMGIDWASFRGRRFPYRSAAPGRHYDLILAAMRAKLDQNPEVARVLLATGDLRLLPDHREEPGAPPEWRYCEIWTQLRSELRLRLARRDAEVWEAAFRWFLTMNPNHDLYFLAVGDCDPPKRLFDRLPAQRARLRQRSQALVLNGVHEKGTGRRGVIVSVSAVEWRSPTEAVVTVSSYCGNVCGSGDQLRVTRVRRRWFAEAFGGHCVS